jgi:signal peptidase
LKNVEDQQKWSQVNQVNWKEILNNDYVKTAVLLSIIIISVFAFWFGLRTALATEFPLCGVASGSMIPTLQVGDLIIVQGVSDASNIEATPKNASNPGGDIIVFYNPRKGFRDPNDLIVHRAINKTFRDEKWYFKTQGDANSFPDNWDVPEDFVIGKVVFFRIPLVGFITFLMRTPAAILVVLPPLILLVMDWIPFFKERDKS